MLVVVAELEVIYEPVVMVVALLVVAWVDMDEEVLVEVSMRIPPEEVEEVMLILEVVVPVVALKLPSPKLKLLPVDSMLCQLPLSAGVSEYLLFSDPHETVRYPIEQG